MRTIGEVAGLAGISIDTLRYYDRIGLLRPQARSTAGYRLYGREELLRLREILIWRQLGFPLRDIAALIDDPTHDQADAVRRQLDLAGVQLNKFHAITLGLELAVKAIDAGRPLSEHEVFDGFATSLSDAEGADGPEGAEPASSREPTGWAIPTFALLSGRPHYPMTDPLEALSPRPQRIVATDPIELGESLIALGILPVGTGTYEDRFSDGFNYDPGCWTWFRIADAVDYYDGEQPPLP